jgi:hypothetical protein
MLETIKETKMNGQHNHAATCDICHQPILAGEKIHDGEDEIVHVACIRNWFRSNWGRERLS